MSKKGDERRDPLPDQAVYNATHRTAAVPSSTSNSKLSSSTKPQVATRQKRAIPGWVAAMICALLIAQFFVLALLAIRQKSATYDENFHVLGSFASLWLRDFRVDPDNFTLWEYWAALPHGPHGVAIDTNYELWKELAEHNADVRDKWAIVQLYRMPGNDADTLLNRSRTMMLVLGVILAAVIARWSFELGGSMAAIFATALFTFDPNFLGHSPLIKNDVPAALVVVLGAYAVWRAGRRVTIWNAIAVALACGAALNVKASVIVLAPIIFVVLMCRAILPADWIVFGRTIRSRGRRLAIVGGGAVACGIFAFIFTWACYGFRFAATADPQAPLNMQSFVDAYRLREYYQAKGTFLPADATEQDWPVARKVKLALWADEHHLLPHAFLCGLVYASAQLQHRPMFLMGQISSDGWWYYFPVASLFKLPMSTLAALAIVPALLGVQLLRTPRKRLRASLRQTEWIWSAGCVVGIAILLLGIAMLSRVNLGVRHIFPVYALMYIALGWIVGAVCRKARWWLSVVPVLLMLGLAIESCAAYPDYIAFFNRASGGSRGGRNLLGDANLDWGQDLKLLGKWVLAHPEERIFLCYQSLADPTYYKIDYTPAFSGYYLNRSTPEVSGRGIMAIDVNSLQGVFADQGFRESTESLRRSPPIEVLGGTIYLYRVAIR